MDIEATELLILMKQLAKLGVREGLLPVSMLWIYRRLPTVVQGAIIKRCGLTALAFGVMGLVATNLCPELQALESTCGLGVGMVLGAVVARLWEPLHFHLCLMETDWLEKRGVITAKQAKEIRARLVLQLDFPRDRGVSVPLPPPPPSCVLRGPSLGPPR
ncbi:hypothetical protein F0U62_45025 [Cystobacter fuscus]|uniref:hypothetical protein n=1 Tax=Cystobacter fuscus TaxID=43 RepID=UPI002B2F01A8|nr:hypothetical protein F0U62_45025 [Cystobacter fuscus]